MKLILSWSIATLFIGGFLALSATVQATPFSKFVGEYEVIGQKCVFNSEDIECRSKPGGIEIIEVSDRSATLLIKGTDLDFVIKDLQLSEFSNAEDIHYHSSAVFYEDDDLAGWVQETRIGDVMSHAIRSGTEVQLREDDNGLTLRVISFRFSGSSGSFYLVETYNLK